MNSFDLTLKLPKPCLRAEPRKVPQFSRFHIAYTTLN